MLSKMLNSAILTFFLLGCMLEGVYTAQPPNIIFVVADDLGWNDVSFHGSSQILTPHIDALAQEGVILTNYYVSPICTPTRSAIMSGKHPIHTGLQYSVIIADEPYGLGTNETIMPQYLRSLGYRTHMVGKWHLGFYSKEHTPIERGFESTYGYYLGQQDYFTHETQVKRKVVDLSPENALVILACSTQSYACGVSLRGWHGSNTIMNTVPECRLRSSDGIH